MNTNLKNIDSDDIKKESFNVDEANAKDFVEETLKKISKEDRSIGATLMDDVMKQVHSAQHNIKATINSNKSSKPQKWLGPLEHIDGAIFEAD